MGYHPRSSKCVIVEKQQHCRLERLLGSSHRETSAEVLHRRIENVHSWGQCRAKSIGSGNERLSRPIGTTCVFLLEKETSGRTIDAIIIEFRNFSSNESHRVQRNGAEERFIATTIDPFRWVHEFLDSRHEGLDILLDYLITSIEVMR